MSDLAFEPSWDDGKQVWRVSVYGFEDEPVELPGIARSIALGKWRALRPSVVAAAQAAPSALSDDGGMYWRTKTEAKKAAKAAREAVR